MQALAQQSKRDGLYNYFKSLGVPTRPLNEATIDEVDAAVWVATSQPFFRMQSLYLWGDTGVGKTFLASLLLMEGLTRRIKRVFLPKGIPVEHIPPMGAFAFVPDLIIELESVKRFDRNSLSRKDIIDRYARASLLILDDIGTEETTPKSIEAITTIIDYRNRERKHTVITSNLNLEQLAQKTSDRIVSRITELCGYGKGIFEITGKDRRLNGGKLCSILS